MKEPGKMLQSIQRRSLSCPSLYEIKECLKEFTNGHQTLLTEKRTDNGSINVHVERQHRVYIAFGHLQFIES